MQVELTPDLVYNILWEAHDLMDKDEFACRVDEVYAECATLIAHKIGSFINPPTTRAECTEAEIIE